MNLIDTHCHLAHPRLRGDLPGVLDRARQAGVAACVCAAGSVDEAASCQALTREFPNLYFIAGVHPHEAKDAGASFLERIEALCGEVRNVGIGEIGLDYHYNFSPPEVQREVFARQVELAMRLGRRIVIHTREAFEDTMAILRSCGAEGTDIVFHSFTEGPDLARRVLDMGAMISFSGIATFKNADLIRATAALAPADRRLVETDAPYLSPEPVRKMKTNEPANVAHVAHCLAAALNVPAEQFAAQTTENAVRFFRLPNTFVVTP